MLLNSYLLCINNKNFLQSFSYLSVDVWSYKSIYIYRWVLSSVDLLLVGCSSSIKVFIDRVFIVLSIDPSFTLEIFCLQISTLWLSVLHMYWWTIIIQTRIFINSVRIYPKIKYTFNIYEHKQYVIDTKYLFYLSVI